MVVLLASDWPNVWRYRTPTPTTVEEIVDILRVCGSGVYPGDWRLCHSWQDDYGGNDLQL